MFRAALEALYPISLAAAYGYEGSPFWVREPSPLDTLTMRAAFDLRSSGSIACVTARAPRKFVRNTRSTASSRAVWAGPSEGSLMPALLTRMSRPPKPEVMVAGSSLNGRIVGNVDRKKAGIDPSAVSVVAAFSPAALLRAPTKTVTPVRPIWRDQIRCPCSLP